MAKRIGNKYFNAQGLEGMQGITQALAMMEATEAGADWDGGLRTSSDGSGPIQSNARILKYLADGGRDIRPDDSDGNKAVKLYVNQLTKRLQQIGNMGKSGPLTAEKQITAGITAGLRDAAKFIAKTMYERVKAGVDNTGTKKDVTPEYAAQRHRKHGIANSVGIVFTATLQLANALQRGRIKIRFNKAGLNRAVRIFKRG